MSPTTHSPGLAHPALGSASWRRIGDKLWSPAVFLAAAAVYGLTLPRTLTWQHDSADGGDLIAAAATLSVPHPSGYPTYILLARLFLLALPLGEPAFRVHWLSALSAAGSASLLALLVLDSRSDDATRRWPTRVASAAAGLALAYSPLFWSQATVAEVYAPSTTSS